MSEYTEQDVETLARELMGWRLKQDSNGDESGTLYLADSEGVFLYEYRVGVMSRSTRYVGRWNPFTDANADVQVLERVRDTWGSEDGADPERDAERWDDFTSRLPAPWSYRTGDYARDALSVLRTTTPATSSPDTASVAETPALCPEGHPLGDGDAPGLCPWFRSDRFHATLAPDQEAP